MFGGVERFAQPSTFIAFERDGTASATQVVLADEDGHALAVEVLPLADAVRILDVEQ